MSAKVIIYDKQKEVKITPEIRRLIRKSCTAVLKSEQFGGDVQIEVSIVDDRQIKELNCQYRGIDKSTDVLSFPLGENGEYDINPENGAYMLGDVVISIEHANYQAELFGHSTDREIAYLTVHSVLHLLGFDHVNSETERAEMRKHEEAVMKILGLNLEKV